MAQLPNHAQIQNFWADMEQRNNERIAEIKNTLEKHFEENMTAAKNKLDATKKELLDLQKLHDSVLEETDKAIQELQKMNEENQKMIAEFFNKRYEVSQECPSCKKNANGLFKCNNCISLRLLALHGIFHTKTTQIINDALLEVPTPPPTPQPELEPVEVDMNG